MLRYWTSKGVYTSKCTTASNFIKMYENLVTSLCPAATTWAVKCWIEVENIYNALQPECNFNYLAAPMEYDILISLFRMNTSPYDLTGDKEFDILRCICNLKHFSLHWATVLWPSNTEENIIKTFLLAAQRAKEISEDEDIQEDTLCPCYVLDVSYHVLSRSWLYSVIQNWANNSELRPRFAKAAKKALFDTSLKL